MLIELTGLGPWGIGHKGANKLGVKGRVLTEVTVCVPGINHLKDDFWAEIKSNPDVKRRIEDRKVFVITEKDPDPKKAEEKGFATELAEMSSEEAEKVVKKCLNKPLLDKWRKEETRPRVLESVKDQLEELKLPTKKPAGS